MFQLVKYTVKNISPLRTTNSLLSLNYTPPKNTTLIGWRRGCDLNTFKHRYLEVGVARVLNKTSRYLGSEISWSCLWFLYQQILLFILEYPCTILKELHVYFCFLLSIFYKILVTYTLLYLCMEIWLNCVKRMSSPCALKVI